MPISISQLREMRTVIMSNGDRYRFQWIDPSALLELLDLRDKGLNDRDYLNQSLDLLIEDPDPANELIAQLSDEQLIELCAGYLNLKVIRRARDEDNESLLHPTTLKGCRRELDTHLDDEAKRMKESSKEVMASFSRIATNMGSFQNLYQTSPIWNYLDSVKPMLDIQTRISDQFHSPLLDYRSPLLESIQAQSQIWAISWISAQTNLTSMYSHIFDVGESIRESLVATTRAIAAIDLPSVIFGWQSVLDQNLVEWAEEIREQHRTAFLIDTNLQFMSDLSEQAIQDIVDDAMDVPERQQPAHITRRLYTFTSHTDFLDSVLQEIDNSPKASRRSEIIRAAHGAHSNRQFLLSVPALLAQIEGLTIQLLNEMGFVRWNRLDKKWYEADPTTGKYRMRSIYKRCVDTGKKERVPVKGLGDLSKFIPKMTQNPLPNTLPHVRDDMPKFRNQVMHGSLTDYGSSRRSSMLLLIARIVIQQLRALEESNRAAC